MSKRYARQLHSADGLIAAVEQHGFLPFFRNEIHGFSIEELCPPELWFADDVDGPWEWKGPAADVYKRQGQAAVDRRAVNLVWHKNNLRFSVWCGTSNQKDEGLLQLL